MKWEVITQMSMSPKFPAGFVAETFNESGWTIADPVGHIGAGFWYVVYNFHNYICTKQHMDMYLLIMHL
jgi:hypothetical protein